MSRREVPLPRLAAVLTATVVVLVVLPGCPSGYVQTSTGATVAASTVHAQDLVGDALHALQDVHNATVRQHDAKAGVEPAEVHAKRREALKASAAGLRAAWSGLEAWKLGTDGAGMVAVVTPLRAALPDLLRAGVALGVISQGYADAIGVFFGTAQTGKAPEALKKEPVQTSAIEEPGEEGYALVQVPHRRAWSSGTLRIVDNGCTADDIARGLCVGGCTSSIPPKCAYWPMGRAQTLEVPLLDRGGVTLLTNPPRTLEVPR